MRNKKALKRLLARVILIVMLVSILTPLVFASGEDFRYAIYFEYFSHDWSLQINGVSVDNNNRSKNEIILTSDDKVRAELNLTSGNGESKFIRFQSSENESATSADTRYDAILLPDGTYAAIRPLSEVLVFDELCLNEDTTALNYSFTFSGEYDAAAVSLSEIRNAEGGHLLFNDIDSSSTYRLKIRAAGHTSEPVPLERKLSEKANRWNFAINETSANQITAHYEVNTGSGWQPLIIDSWVCEASDREDLIVGHNYIYDGYSFSFRTAYGETPTFELIDPVTVKSAAASAAVAAVGAAAASAAVSASASSVGESAAESALSSAKDEPVRSLIINGGAPYPLLSNTEKTTVEIPLNIDNGLEPYTWSVISIVPDCLDAVIASAVPPVGNSSCAVVMIRGKKLPQSKISVFLNINAVGVEDTLSSTIELALYEKGLFAKIKDAAHPELPESYEVTSVKDANLDGIAEVKTLNPTEYTVVLYEDRAVIHAEKETAAVELKND